MFSKLCGYAGCTLSIVLIVLWSCNTGGFSVVNLDSFVGVIVALLSILITIVLGWQIYNAIEMKQKIQELEALKDEFAEQKKSIEELSNKTRHGVLLTWGDDSANARHFTTAFRFYVSSLKCSMLLKEPLNIDVIHDNLTIVSNNLKKGNVMNKDLYDIVINEDTEIRSLPNYIYIKSWYEPAFEKFISNIIKK
ncbi:MAG: hypothetical protein IKW84_09650 [Bacteroidaceae bacterium]|nr:hypothetical protein [Bacteroidaceae bacterium]